LTTGLNQDREHNPNFDARQCNGRVVGPKPKHEPYNPDGDDKDHTITVPNPIDSDSNDDSVFWPPAVTFPLKDVMRHEAAKHVVPRSTDAAKNEPLCDLFRSVEPDAPCDEAFAQHNVRLFYLDNCGEKTKAMVPWIDCQKLRQEVKKIWPDVDNELEAGLTLTGDEVAKEGSFCKNDAPCDSDLRHSVNTPHLHGRKRICIYRAYARIGSLWGDSENVWEIMNTIFDDRYWTSDDEVCDRNIDFPKTMVKKERRCIRPYCRHPVQAIGDADCDDAESALEDLSRYAGYDIDWTTNDEVCHGWNSSLTVSHIDPVTRTSSNHLEPTTHQMREHLTMHNRRAHYTQSICIHKAYELLGPLWGDKHNIRANMNKLFIDRIWTSDDEVCNRHSYFPVLKRGKECARPYCQPVISGADCSDVESALEDLSKDAGYKVEWTTDDEACNPAWMYTPTKSTAPVSHWTPRPTITLTFATTTQVPYFMPEPTLDTVHLDPALHQKRDFVTMCNVEASRLLDPLVGHSNAKTILNSLFEDRAWTSDADVCRSWSHNIILPEFHRREHRCYLNFCPLTLPSADCSDVEGALDKVSMMAGYPIDWTSSDDECRHG
jgi:hypothetical protein